MSRGAVARGRFAPILVALAAWCGCSDPDDDDPRVAICNGDPSVRLVFQVAGGGQVLPGSEVTSENGFQYLLVEGSCRAWILRDPSSEVRTTQLTAAEAERLAGQLHVARWASLQGEYTSDLCDGPQLLLRFDRARIEIASSCGGGDSSGPVASLADAARAQIDERYAAATPIDGAVRFVLVAEPPGAAWPPDVTSAAARWPLATAPEALAISRVEALRYRPGSSRSAAPPDAGALRALRRRFLGAGGGALSGGFIPVLDDGGSRYELFVRDSIPLEDAHGLVPID